MNRRPRAWVLICLIGLLGSLLLAGAVTVRHRYFARGVVTGFPEPVADAEVTTLGVNAALEQYQSDQLTWAVNLIASGGFRWVRQVFPWREIEPIPGEYDWATWDRVVAAMDERGLQLVAVLHTAPAWAQADPRAPHPFGPPTDLAAFSAFAAAFAARYGDQVDYYQVWDEPNLYDGWGGQYPDAAAYTALLCAAADTIRQADPEARILLAGLAPTVETGPRNLSDHLYLRALYQADAAPCFDIVAAKPYGFDTGPDDRRIDPELLNFSRLLLLREQMEAHNDADRAIWAVNWGWNALPDGWDGRPSLWGETDETTQARRTVASIERARAEWPWMGAMILENFQPPPPLDPQLSHAPLSENPRWGFALVARDGIPRPVYNDLRALVAGPPIATPGVYPASTELATFEGHWELDPPGASAMADGDTVSLPFEGSGVALTVARSPYLGYLYVTVDSQPANALPRDPQGRAYAPLYGALGEATAIPLATGLPEGRHTVTVTVGVGGGGWWLVDWRVARERDDVVYCGVLAGVGVLALLSAVGAFLSALQVRWGTLGQAIVAAHDRVTKGAQVALTAVAAVLRASAWEVWYERAVAGFGGLGDGIAITTTLAAAAAFYFSPWLPLTLVSGLALAALILLRLDLGLALVAATAPFYRYPRPLFGKAFSMAEITTLLCLLSWGLRQLATWHNQPTNHPPNQPPILSFSSLDRAVLFFVVTAIASTFFAEYRHVALRELRVVVLEPAFFYLMLRTSRLDGKALWRIVDLFVLGAVAVALIGLVQYGLGVNIITAEQGFRRLRSVYGSPNNAGLYLGRVLPVLVAVAMLATARGRRVAYGLATVPVGLAVLLSFSKGAMILGVPLSLLALGMLAGRPWFWASLGTVTAAAIAAIPLLRTPRFASLLDTRGGTTFFRLQLWQSSWIMFRDHLWLGVGPDNFLYHYRSRYILPAAWQEPDLSHPHNTLLDYGCRLGLCGLVAGFWLQIAFWRLALPLRRPAEGSTGLAGVPDRRALALGLMGSMVNFLAHGLVDASYFVIDLAFVFFLTLGVVQWLARSETDELET
jgi:O-antigen ligase